MWRKNKKVIYTIDGSFKPPTDRGKPFRLASKILVSTFALIVIFMMIGFGYALWTNQNVEDIKIQAAAEKALETKPFVAKPTKPAANAPVGVAVYLDPTPIKPGTNVSITARTVATATCTITVTYNNISSKDSGLTPKKADDYGSAVWTWTVDQSAPAGSWPAKVICAYNGRTGVGQGFVNVIK